MKTSGPNHTRTLAVCVPTCRRPRQLARLLRRLARARLPAGVELEVRVVDNDPERSAQPVLSTAARWAGLAGRLRVEVETEPGVAHVRNRLLDMGPADLVAFIDDDAWPEPDCLVELVAELDRSGADLVLGYVLYELPPRAPRWLRRGRFLDCACGGPGAPLNWTAGRTSNLLARGRWFFERGFRFDPLFGRTGGEDAELCSRLELAGATMVAAPRAIVREELPRGRTSLPWLLRREARCGSVHERVKSRRPEAHHPALRNGAYVVRAVPKLAKGLLASMFGRPERLVDALLANAWAWGGMLAWLRPHRAARIVAYGHAQRSRGG
jgi:succinoglycan biosynthesis protein ExoM